MKKLPFLRLFFEVLVSLYYLTNFLDKATVDSKMPVLSVCLESSHKNSFFMLIISKLRNYDIY